MVSLDSFRNMFSRSTSTNTATQAPNQQFVLGLPQTKQGDSFAVDGPLWYDGNATVRRYDSQALQLDITLKGDSQIPYAVKNGMANVSITLVKNPDGRYNLTILDNNNPANVDNQTVSAVERMVGVNKEITFASTSNRQTTFLISPNGSMSIKPQGSPFSLDLIKGAGYSGMPYASDVYKTSPYMSGYVGGVTMVGPIANNITGMATSITTVSNIFVTVIDLMASILNTIVNLIAKMISGVMGLFGGKKEDKPQGVNAMQTANRPMNQPMVMSPKNTPVPTPPATTNLNQAYDFVQQDLKNVKDPNQFIQIINTHMQKANDYKNRAEQLSLEAEKESKNTLIASQMLQKNPNDRNALNMLQNSKTKAMNLIKTAEQFTNAVYDEALYVQAALDTNGNKFKNVVGANYSRITQDAWKNWLGSGNDNMMLAQKLANSMNNVNNNIAQATKILSSLTTQR